MSYKNNWQLFKEFAPKELFLKVGHINLSLLKGAAKVWCDVALTDQEYDELCGTIREIEAYRTREKYENTNQ